MKKLIYLLMSLSVVAFASCSDDKEKTSSNGGSSVYKSGTQDGHDYVDLGLPSGTLWATCNVGATKSEDSGNLYAWGETTTKVYYDWSTYKYANGDYKKLTKYCHDHNFGNNGFTDSKTTLDLSDDAAYVNWGGKWRMPTKAQQEELVEQCYWVWTENYNNSHVKGYIVYKAKTSSDKGVEIYKGEALSSSYKLSDAHIFLPAVDIAGYKYNGCFWSSSLHAINPCVAWGAYFYSDDAYYYYDQRCYGQSVRAVIPGY